MFIAVKIENSIEIAAPVSRVWELTLDVESWPQYSPTFDSIERLDTEPVGIGSEVRVKQPRQRAKVWTVTALEAEQLFAWSTKAMGMSMTATHSLSAAETRTTNTLSVEVDGPLSSLIGPLVRRPIAKAIATENQGFKAAAEQ